MRGVNDACGFSSGAFDASKSSFSSGHIKMWSRARREFLIQVVLTSVSDVSISGLMLAKHCALSLTSLSKELLKHILGICVCTWESYVRGSNFCLATLVRHSAGGHVTCSRLLGLPTNVELFIMIARVCRRVVSCCVLARKKGLPCWN